MTIIVIFIISFILCATVLKRIVNSFMGLMGASIYSFNVKTRVIICTVVALFITSFLAGMV
ncbi:MAG: hypothetical protein LUH00_03005 [Lachnospiraceae bacterium]|nr:hypothetical protein [Lachnospiraceae bacterium]